jgi:hypothetical protein
MWILKKLFRFIIGSVMAVASYMGIFFIGIAILIAPTIVLLPISIFLFAAGAECFIFVYLVEVGVCPEMKRGD